ncbi:MAG: bifunctional phosphopantothenoylcysteine decarboxylase/phosphopantothenate--cysteine ligase CoaBC [Candidatus Endonucleobacter bathymodioli]|uniref:Coenzyme A biosynthesis bifunctional protein CoaBC n=1 Tax=Candidatus Endonucleibacter bathymodioli TaxID=539814 RepID=A0AA90NMB5_9GAMM|nr:bifunctional phosphopantothenoylcysteine decarboxylase/phosphopantothenate--cysteine ligase CoaBC [Candidatus Endonucleobacter bathymodioli]
MEQLRNKRIILGVSGGIAAYKSADLIRKLTSCGTHVRVVMTAGACEFITPLTMQALSHNPVHLDLLDTKAEAAMGHIELARWADLILIAPATADFIARLTGGHADDLLTTLCLATSAPISLAPAMNQGMWCDDITQQNCQELLKRNIRLLGPASGSLACGDEGPGRMIEPELIVEQISEMFQHNALSGVSLMITAGPTHENIDPVRYLSNYSSGKMGYSLAEAAIEAGATVTLISGPVHIPVPDRVNCINVISAREMHQTVHNNIQGVDIFIGCAAVCDYRPEKTFPEKIKKDPEDSGETKNIKLVQNPDIIASVSTLHPHLFVIGFAAETQKLLSYAKDKLKRKKLNLIVANNVSSTNGFNSDSNEVTILGHDFEESLPRTSKKVLSGMLLKIISRVYNTWKAEQD